VGVASKKERREEKEGKKKGNARAFSARACVLVSSRGIATYRLPAFTRASSSSIFGDARESERHRRDKVPSLSGDNTEGARGKFRESANSENAEHFGFPGNGTVERKREGQGDRETGGSFVRG